MMVVEITISIYRECLFVKVLEAGMTSPKRWTVVKGNQHLRRAFVQGILIGLLLVFVWTCHTLVTGGRGGREEMPARVEGSLHDDDKMKLVAFVGVQSGFTKPRSRLQYVYEMRREVLRDTWFPSPREALDAFEEKSGIRVRFVIGHSSDATAEYNIDIEQQRHGDILRLDIVEDYLSLPYKILTFLRYVSSHFDTQYIVKVDDDVYFSLDRLPYAVLQWTEKEADYIGCMKRGQVFTQPGQRWREPQHPLLGDGYYTHVWGCAYSVSGRAASFISAIPIGSLRFLNNEDTTIGAWMLAFNVTYFDDRRLCSTSCTPYSLAVYDIPTCAGLCEPQTKMKELFRQKECQLTSDEVPLLSEIIQVNAARSQQLPPEQFVKDVAS